MADESIAPTRDGSGFYAVLASLTGTGVTTVDGDFLTPLGAAVPTGYCIHYKEDATPTSVAITWQAKVGVDANEYDVSNSDGSSWTQSFTGVENKQFIPFVDTTTAEPIDFSGVGFLKPVITAAGGAGGAAAILKITVVGRVPDSGVLARRK